MDKLTRKLPRRPRVERLLKEAARAIDDILEAALAEEDEPARAGLDPNDAFDMARARAEEKL